MPQTSLDPGKRPGVHTRRRKRRGFSIGKAAALLLAAAAALALIGYVSDLREQENEENLDASVPEWIDVRLLTPNKYSRPGIALKKVRGIVVHYTANPGSTAMQNRDYFESLSLSGGTYASSHFIIGIDGSVVQCVPTTEIAYCSNSRNSDTVSIECCHADASGKLSEETYASLVKLTKWLMNKYGLDAKSVIRHYDVTGKLCPKYFVDHPDKWKAFLKEIDE